MRLATVLSQDDLPAVELQVGVLDGELVRIGDAYCAIDAVIGSEQRAESIATEVPHWAIAERLTAAWVYGVIDAQPQRLHLCVTSQSKIRPLSSSRCSFREVVLSDSDVVAIGGLSVTSPLRTVLDIARIDEGFSKLSVEVVRGLASIGQGFGLEECTAELARRRNLPHKRLALERLTAALPHRVVR